MLSALRRVIALLPTLLALGTFLLPSGWAICIGPDGHLAVEPVVQLGATCCAPATAPSGTDSCVPGPDSDCQDVALSSGAAGFSRPDPDLGAPLASQLAVTVPGMAHPNLTCLLSPRTPAGLIVHPSSGAGTTLLRC